MRRILKVALPNLRPDRLVLALDLAGTFLFAVQGADLAIAAHLDLLGVAVIAFVSSLGGGIIRDVLIGAVPPAAFRDWRYGLVALIAGLVAFVSYGFLRVGVRPGPARTRRGRAGDVLHRRGA